MSPNKHYEVLESVEINGTLHDAGAIIEMVEADAQPFVDAGKLKEHGEGSAPAPTTPPAPENTPGSANTAPAQPSTPAEPAAPAAPSTPAPTPAAAEEKPKSWVGNHTVGGNEPARTGGALNERHPDLKK